MSDFHSDALVFFGATGDLAYKKIFPALQAMLKRGHLNIPVIGVAKSGWNLDQFRERAQESVVQHGAESPPPRTFATKPSYRRRPFEYFDHTLYVDSTVNGLLSSLLVALVPGSGGTRRTLSRYEPERA